MSPQCFGLGAAVTLTMSSGPPYVKQLGLSYDPAGQLHGYVPSELIPADIERTVEDAQDIDVTIVLDQIGDAVVAVEEDPHMAP